MLRARESAEYKAQSLDRPSCLVSSVLGAPPGDAREPSLLSQGIILTTGPVPDTVAAAGLLRGVCDIQAVAGAVSSGGVDAQCVDDQPRGSSAGIDSAAGAAAAGSLGTSETAAAQGGDVRHSEFAAEVGLPDRRCGWAAGAGAALAGDAGALDASSYDVEAAGLADRRCGAAAGAGVARGGDAGATGSRCGQATATDAAVGVHAGGSAPADQAAAQGRDVRDSEFAAEAGFNSSNS